MLSPEKAGQLKALLGQLPRGVATRLAEAVEVDRLAGGTLLPHALILDALRPILRDAGDTQRTLTPVRFFAAPFEDLLTGGPRKEKRKGRIGRDSVVPVWSWASQLLLPFEASAYAAAVKNASLAQRPDEAHEKACEFWVAISEAMRAAIARDRDEARRALGSELVVADAEEMAVLLSAGREFTELQQKLARGTQALTEELIWTLRGIYDRIVAFAPDAAPYVAVLAMNRLAHPWEALKLPLHISRQTSDTLISATDIGLAGEVLLADLEVHGNAIRATRHPAFNAGVLTTHLAEFARLSSGLVQEVELRRDGPWHQRLMKDRKAVADAMEALMERAPREILAAMPVHKTGAFGGGPTSPDITRPLDPDKTERGLRYARLVMGCRKFAAAASFGAAHKAALDEASQHLKVYADDIVREVRATEGTARLIAEQYFSIACDFTQILFSEEEADLLRRRGRVAVAAAA